MKVSRYDNLVLIQVKDSGMCGICGVRQTSTWCTSCLPQHYLCNGCFESHKVATQTDPEKKEATATERSGGLPAPE
jgi:hypothetical protein